MQFLIGLLISFLIGFICYFAGRLILNKLEVKEDNSLLQCLLKLAFGLTFFLIATNLISTIFRSFFIGLAITGALLITALVLQGKDLRSLAEKAKTCLSKDSINEVIKSNKYLLILAGVVNFIYLSLAISSVPDTHSSALSNHIFNINQLVAGNYPPRYSFLPTLSQKFHYGADILASAISRFSGIQPEVALDVLTLIFVNLILFTIYALTVKFVDSESVNKILVPFAALIAWGPIILLLKNNSAGGPAGWIDKTAFLTQTKLNEAAKWSGLTLYWVFDPPTCIGIFFVLISLYLIFRIINGEKDLKFAILTGVFVSSLVIVDITKLVFLAVGLFLYILFTSPIPMTEDSGFYNQPESKQMLKNLGIVIAVAAVLGIIHQNWFIFNKDFLPIGTFYKFGSTNLAGDYSNLNNNILLLVLYAVGFYTAYKTKHKWLIFLIPFYLSGLLIPYFVSMPDAGIGKFAMMANLVGPLSLPLGISFLQDKFSFIKERKTLVLWLFIALTSFSTLMYFTFGGAQKPLFILEGKKLKYTGLQNISFQGGPEELEAIKALKLKNLRDQAILCEEQFSNLFSVNTGLYAISSSVDLSGVPVKKEAIEQGTNNFTNFFNLQKDAWIHQKVNWFYVTPEIFNSVLSPQSKIKLLNTYLNNKLKLVYSNKSNSILNQKELYQISPVDLSTDSAITSIQKFEKFLESEIDKAPMYIKQAALSPYTAIYNAKSNDFDGDRIADISFFDQKNKKWIILPGNGGEKKEIIIPLTSFEAYNNSDILIPIPSDFNGDSKTDLALFNRTKGYWYVFSPESIQPVQSNKFCYWIDETPLPGDLDGDMKTDITCFNATRKSWPSLLSGTNFNFAEKRVPVNQYSKPMYMYIDEDSKADYALYSPSEQLFTAYLSTKDYDTSRSIRVLIGGISSVAVPGDYDGDKKEDLAVWSPETGIWEIAYAKDLIALAITNPIGVPQPIVGCGIAAAANNTAPKNCVTHTFEFGKTGDIPLPADYNGDGRTDIAVYHQDTNKLEISFGGGAKKEIDLSEYKGLDFAGFIGI